jgi:hypothetical protein
MSREIEVGARILGGLPVLVFATIYPAEPDIGIFSEQVEVGEVCWLSGKPLPDKVCKRMKRKDDDACIEAVREALSN